MLAEDLALHRHPEVLPSGHDDLVDEVDHNPAHECAGRREVDVAWDRTGFGGVRGSGKEKEHRAQPRPRLQRNSSRSGNSSDAVTGSCLLSALRQPVYATGSGCGSGSSDSATSASAPMSSPM